VDRNFRNEVSKRYTWIDGRRCLDHIMEEIKSKKFIYIFFTWKYIKINFISPHQNNLKNLKNINLKQFFFQKCFWNTKTNRILKRLFEQSSKKDGGLFRAYLKMWL
jgi:hypothetical protein